MRGALGANGKPITLPCHNTFKQELRIDCTCTPPASCPVDPSKPFYTEVHVIEVYSDHVVITRDGVSQTIRL